MATIENRAAEGQRIQQEAKQYVLHSWSVQNAINPLPVAGAEGRYFWDYEGKRYLDFASQLVNLSIGHQHPKIVAAIKEQADKLCTIGPPMATEPRSTLGRYLAELTPGDLRYSFFTNGGAEANENGIIVPPDGYLQSIREVCDRHGILLITDEVMAGFGRTGAWFAVDHWDVVPDIITLAKGINSGYVPLGAMVVRSDLAEWVQDKFFAGGLTYSGHPLACAAAVASIEAFKEEGIVENAAERGEDFRAGLHALAARHPPIGDVRGLGCFWGLELVKNRETREPLVPFNGSGEAAAPGTRLAKAAVGRGLFLVTDWEVIIVCSALTC